MVEYNEVSPGYFATTGIPIVAGREFIPADDQDAPPVAVVNQTMAAQYWHGADPIGKRVQANGRWMQVVGIAKNSKYENMLEPAEPFFYVPLRQNFFTDVGLLVRTWQNPASIAPLLAHSLPSAGDRALLRATAVMLDAPVSLGKKIPIALDLRGAFHQARDGQRPDLSKPFESHGAAADPNVAAARVRLIHALERRITRAFRPAFVLCAAFAAVALGLAYLLRRRLLT